MFLRNLENQIGQVATALSNRHQGSLLSNVHIPVGVSKRKVEPNSTQEEAQIEEEPQQPIFQHTSERS